MNGPRRSARTNPASRNIRKWNDTLVCPKPVALMMPVTGRHPSPKSHTMHRRFGSPKHFEC